MEKDFEDRSISNELLQEACGDVPGHILRLKAMLPALGERYRIAFVDVFGSFVNKDWTPKSDLDLIIDFVEPKREKISQRYFGFLHSLEDAFGCEVDLLTENAIKNPFFLKTIKQGRFRIYG